MNELERFKAVVHFEKPDYFPIFGFGVGSSLSAGCMKKTHDRLVEMGMRAHDADAPHACGGDGRMLQAL